MRLNADLIIMLTLLVLGAGCNNPDTSPESYKHDQIHFGQGGGFTGQVTYYVLLEDGRLFQRALRDSSYSLLETWSSSFTKQMFLNYKALHIDVLEFYEPGDLYYFLEYRTPDTAPHRLAWGRSGYKADENLVQYYNLLFKSTKSKS